MREILRVRNLRTSFPARERHVRVVDGVDLSLHRGRTLALVGESGCGKSMTAMSIMRLVPKPGRMEPGGEVVLGHQSLADLPKKKVQAIRGNDLAMIFQEPMTSLNPVYRVGDQVAEGIRRHRGMSRRGAAFHAVEMLDLVKIPAPKEVATSYPHQLSGGMRQRAMIAMALSCGPQVLIADEPTTALDATIQAQILELLGELRDRHEMSILLITHDFGVVAELADEVAVMYAGRIVETGTANDIFDAPQHPYTEALLQSIPVPGMDPDKPLTAVPGVLPTPGQWPSGCRFAPRCHYAFSECTEYPATFATGNQATACWLHGQGQRVGEPVEAANEL